MQRALLAALDGSFARVVTADAWFKNNLIYLPGSGISSLPFNGDLGIARLWAGYKGVENRGEEMWFCLQKSTGEEGWVKFADRAQWQPGAPGNGVFLGQP